MYVRNYLGLSKELKNSFMPPLFILANGRVWWGNATETLCSAFGGVWRFFRGATRKRHRPSYPADSEALGIH